MPDYFSRQLPVHARQCHQLLLRRRVHVHQLRVVLGRRQIERVTQTGFVQFTPTDEPPERAPSTTLAQHGAWTLPHLVGRHFEIIYRS